MVNGETGSKKIPDCQNSSGIQLAKSNVRF